MLSVTTRLLKGLWGVTVPLAPAHGGVTAGNRIGNPAALMSVRCVWAAGSNVRHPCPLWEQHGLSWAANPLWQVSISSEGHLGNAPGVSSARSRGTPRCCQTLTQAPAVCDGTRSAGARQGWETSLQAFWATFVWLLGHSPLGMTLDLAQLQPHCSFPVVTSN